MTAKKPQIVIVADAAAVAEAAARRLLNRISHGNRAAVCLTGGSSPLGLYHLLASDPWRNQVPWDRVHWFVGDDRFVPESDPLSNMGTAKRIFLDRVPAPPQNIHPIRNGAVCTTCHADFTGSRCHWRNAVSD
jgi:6-phosphogluconolactonase/glucosamine-6-phosphate isomerase/deaminase